MNTEFNEIILGIKRAVGLLNAREKRSLYGATSIMLITGMLTPLPAVILGRLVDTLVDEKNIQLSVVIPYILMVILIILIREGLTVVRKYLIENIATQVDKEQTVRVIERLLKAEIGGFLQQQQIGSLHGRVFRSMQGLIQILKLTFLDFAPMFFIAASAIAIAFYQKPFIATCMVLVIPAGLFFIVKQVSTQKGIRVSLLRGREQVDGRVVEMLGGIETIRVLDTVPYEVHKIEEIAEKLRKIEIRHHIYMSLFDAVKYLNEGFFYIVVIVVSLYLASQGIISKGDILVYSILYLSIVSPLREIHRILDQAHESSIQVNDLFNLLHEPIDSSYVEKEILRREKIKNNIVVQTHDVSFSYAGNGKKGILDKINLTVKKGERVGIAGVSGCGKTTFMHILLRMIHGYSGRFFLFGKDLLKISREEIADKIAYVPQKPFIFSGTIKENILYGIQRGVSEERLIDASRNARIYSEIQNNLGGFNGRVSENGSNLSGGQRQRLALARVMLKTPELIIFDEATSSLDNTNESAVQENIEAIFSGVTMILVAHRLTTLKNCDRILVFDKGHIVQEGTYKALSNMKGLFQDFLKQKETVG